MHLSDLKSRTRRRASLRALSLWPCERRVGASQRPRRCVRPRRRGGGAALRLPSERFAAISCHRNCSCRSSDHDAARGLDGRGLARLAGPPPCACRSAARLGDVGAGWRVRRASDHNVRRGLDGRGFKLAWRSHPSRSPGQYPRALQGFKLGGQNPSPCRHGAPPSAATNPARRPGAVRPLDGRCSLDSEESHGPLSSQARFSRPL